MSKPKDDLEAVRIVVEAIEGFNPDDQKRIIRWALEKSGLKDNVLIHSGATSVTPSAIIEPSTQGISQTSDIRSFMQAKNPQSDTHFAAAVAYYYRFQAPPAERKEEINSEDLQEACRKADRSRMKKPIITLGNAHRDGLLDKGSERGSYIINSVGENLVAMALPSSGTIARTPKANKNKKATKKSKSR